MRSDILLLIGLFSVSASHQEGCLPGCECGTSNMKGDSQYRLITCQQFPTQQIPQRYSGFKAKESPKHLSDGSLIYVENIKTLDLCESGIEVVDAKAFAKLVALEILKLSSNKISEISPTAFQGCNNLKELYLDGSHISSLDRNCLVGMPKLEKLYLQNNKLSVLPPLPPSLTHLDASYNLIGPINDYKFQKNIKYLDLCGNQAIDSIKSSCLSEASLTSLCTSARLEHDTEQSLSRLKNVTFVAATPGAYIPTELIEQLEKMQDLEHLTLIGYTISDHSWRFLNPTTKVLNTIALEHITADESSSQQLVQLLSQQTQLEYLSLANSPSLASSLINNGAIWQTLTALEHLSLKDCKIESLNEMQGHGLAMYLDLSNNPLHCDCPFINKFVKKDIFVENGEPPALCATPAEQKEQTLDSVIFSNQECKVEEDEGNPEFEGDKADNDNDYTKDIEDPGTDNNDSNPSKDKIQPSWEEKSVKNENLESGDKTKLALTILGVIFLLAVIAATVFAVFFFYFRRRGQMGIVGTEHAKFAKESNTKDSPTKYNG